MNRSRDDRQEKSKKGLLDHCPAPGYLHLVIEARNSPTTRYAKQLHDRDDHTELD